MADDSQEGPFTRRLKELLRVLAYVVGGVIALSPAIGAGYLLWRWTGDGLKYIAGFTAALAVLLGAGFIGYPLVKLARVFQGLQDSVRELTDQTLPVIGELQGTVEGANQELGKIAVVTDDVAHMSGHLRDTTGSISRTTKLVSDVVVVPFIKLKALGIAARKALGKKG
ncbi:MAG: DUF948 domain-containing protein [Propionibacteriaceae bacterium]|jgi:methyl-accepting chemotaxis protein|nr:DUF948 domain-containing protein [Propionibacteriaceae bacterium]